MANSSFVTTVIILFFVLFIVVTLIRAVRIVPQSYAIIVERLGKFRAVFPGGIHLLVPFVDRIRSTVDLREQVVSFPPQPVITSDNLVVSIDSVIYYQVTDPMRATYEISNYLQAIEQLTITTLRNVIGSMELEQTLTSRDQINTQLRGVLDQATGRWGIRVANVELKSIDPPASIQGAMEQQMRAERDKRAAVLTAEGVKQSQILTAEGDKQSAVLRAEGQAQAAILKAQGESRAILQVFEAIHRGNADPKLLAYQYLQTLPKIANGSSSKMWIVPTEFTAALNGLAGALGGTTPPTGSGPENSEDGAAVGVDLSGLDDDLGIASNLAQTSLQAPEEALAQARDEVETATQVADGTDSDGGVDLTPETRGAEPPSFRPTGEPSARSAPGAPGTPGAPGAPTSSPSPDAYGWAPSSETASRRPDANGDRSGQGSHRANPGDTPRQNPSGYGIC